MNCTMKERIFYIILSCCLLAYVLTGCQLGKHYTRPDLDLPQGLPNGIAGDSASMADYSWQEIYTDTLLQELIEQTLVYNKDMLIAAARVKELAAMKRIDFANLFPSVNFRGYAEKEADNYGGDAYSPDNQFDLKAVVSWELDLWGKLRWAKDASVAEFVDALRDRPQDA